MVNFGLHGLASSYVEVVPVFWHTRWMSWKEDVTWPHSGNKGCVDPGAVQWEVAMAVCIRDFIYKAVSFFNLIQPEDGNCNVFRNTGTASAGPTEWGFYLRTETECSLRNVVLTKNRTMVNVQKFNNCIKIYHRHKLLYLIYRPYHY